MKHLFKYLKRICEGDKIPRKYKKYILGKKLSKTQLKKNIKEFKVIYHQKNIYESSIFSTKPFCPKCGCIETRSGGNMAEYPELWHRIYCLRCGEVVCEADNSTYFHVLEDIVA